MGLQIEAQCASLNSVAINAIPDKTTFNSSKEKRMPKIIKPGKFKNDMNAYILQGLFWETQIYARNDRCLYTFAHEDIELDDGRKLKSITKAYLDMSDPTEYEFACLYFDNWEHWLQIANSSGCADWVDRMRSELAVKLRSEAIKRIITHSSDEKGFQAAKWLAEKGWSKKAGRPSKAKRTADIKEDKEINAAVKQDAANAGISVQ